jgi:hypothetical protein
VDADHAADAFAYAASAYGCSPGQRVLADTQQDSGRLFEYVQTVPTQWGKVIRFELRSGKLVAITESGNVVIVRR